MKELVIRVSLEQFVRNLERTKREYPDDVPWMIMNFSYCDKEAVFPARGRAWSLPAIWQGNGRNNNG
jgi:hypothetical protein